MCCISSFFLVSFAFNFFFFSTACKCVFVFFSLCTMCSPLSFLLRVYAYARLFFLIVQDYFRYGLYGCWRRDTFDSCGTRHENRTERNSFYLFFFVLQKFKVSRFLLVFFFFFLFMYCFVFSVDLVVCSSIHIWKVYVLFSKYSIIEFCVFVSVSVFAFAIFLLL